MNVNVNIICDASGREICIPGILTKGGLLECLIEYFLEHYTLRSLRWMDQCRLAVRRFLEYAVANSFESRPEKLFMKFAHALELGTFDIHGFDQSGLCWLPASSAVANNSVTSLNDFFSWAQHKGALAIHPNPPSHESAFDQILREAAYQHQKQSAFLGHTWAINSTSSSQGTPRRMVAVRAVRSRELEPPAFPEQHFNDLIFRGFNVKGKLSYRDILITLLMNGAGYRASEPFHLFVSDVTNDPFNQNSALVLIHHPSQGSVPDRTLDVNVFNLTTRAAYLKVRWGALPRNQLRGTKHAGWKGGLHDKIDGAKFFRAEWFSPDKGEMFWDFWKRYLVQLASVPRNHPYAFVNLTEKHAGAMYSMKTFRTAHERAVQRIGLPVGKDYGTTEHGHRHAYGQRLKRGGVDAVLRKRCMHHSSIHSQDPYMQSTTAEITSALRIAGRKLTAATEPHGEDLTEE